MTWSIRRILRTSAPDCANICWHSSDHRPRCGRGGTAMTDLYDPDPPRASGGGSVTVWLGDLKRGGDAASQLLWERYCRRLVGLARTQLRGAPRGVADEEDAALDAFNSFLAGVARGRFPQLHDRDDLWRLLVVLTIRKAAGQRRHL